MDTNLSNRTSIWRIVTFLVLAFGLSSIFYVLIISGGEGIEPWLMPLMLCPGVSAIITKLIFDRNLKGLGWKPGPAKWLGLGYLLPILYGAIIYGIAWLLGLGGFTTDVVAELVGSGMGMADAPRWQVVAIFTFFMATIVYVRGGLPGSLGEELGWRGFLFPELQRMISFTTASLISGVVWALFHLPLILFSDYHSTAPIAFTVVVFFISTIAHTFVNNWLRAKSGSVWPAVLLHTSHNVFINNVYDLMMTRYPLTDFFVTEFGLGMLVINVLLALYVWAHRSELEPKSEATIAMTANQPTAAD